MSEPDPPLSAPKMYKDAECGKQLFSARLRTAVMIITAANLLLSLAAMLAVIARYYVVINGAMAPPGHISGDGLPYLLIIITAIWLTFMLSIDAMRPAGGELDE